MKVVKTEFHVMGRKTTICLLTLDNGFEIAGSSSCVNPENFDEKIGQYYARQKALSKLDGFIGYDLQLRLYREENEVL